MSRPVQASLRATAYGLLAVAAQGNKRPLQRTTSSRRACMRTAGRAVACGHGPRRRRPHRASPSPSPTGRPGRATVCQLMNAPRIENLPAAGQRRGPLERQAAAHGTARHRSPQARHATSLLCSAMLDGIGRRLFKCFNESQLVSRLVSPFARQPDTGTGWMSVSVSA